ncbi:MAG: hypothetical protein ACFCVD_22785 [Nodosilinea sp.]
MDSLQQTRDRLISGKLSVKDLDIQFPPSMTAEPPMSSDDLLSGELLFQVETP